MRDLLIVGVDPGVNLGYALLNIDGEVLKYGCLKNIGLDNFIKLLVKSGKVVIIGTDRKNVPGFVEKLGAILKTRIIHPDEDLLVKDKRRLIKDFKVSNKHEMDALASGIFTYKKIRKLMKKVDVYLEKKNMDDFSGSMKDLVLKEEISLDKALDLLLSK